KMKDKEGEKWLKDLRQWWRRSGRSLEMPVDGVSAATRAVGTHQLSYKGHEAPLKSLPAGDYNLVVEAAREVGGRELLRLPFTWPQAGTASARGTSELGAISLTVKPRSRKPTMNRMLKWTALTLAVTLPLTAKAHRAWMLPSATVL